MCARKSVETPRSEKFDIKIGIQTHKPLNWHHGGCTCTAFIMLRSPFYPCGDEGAIN